MTYLQKHKIDAIKYNGRNDSEVVKFIQDKHTSCYHDKRTNVLTVIIKEFEEPIKIGSWIVYEDASIKVYDDKYVRDTYSIINEEEVTDE